MATADGELEQWMQAIESLLASIETWCGDKGWNTARERKQICESKLGAYELPVLLIRGPNGATFYVEPVARYVAGGAGLVDVYGWPSMRRMLLVREPTGWVLKTDSGVPWPRPWSRQTFEEIAPSLAA